MRINILFFCPLILVCLFSCTEKTQETGTSESNELNPESYNIQVDLDNSEKDKAFSDFIDEYELVRLETDSNALIGRIDKILVIKNHIWILDRTSARGVFKFDRSGKFITQIGGNGPGPGEYTTLTDFTYNPEKEEVILVDNAGKLIHYSLDGELIKESSPNNFTVFYIATLAENQSYVFIIGGRDLSLVVTDSNLKNEKRYFPFLNRVVNALISDPVQRTYDNKVLARRYLIDTIYQVSLGGIEPYISFDFLDYQAPYEEISKPEINMDALARYCVISSCYELPGHIVFKFRQRGIDYLGIFNKKNNKVISLEQQEVFNDITFENNSSMIGVDPNTNTVIYKVEANYLKKGIKDSESEHSDLPNWKKAAALAEQITNQDNPIIMFAKLK